jgi:hypothetical protein
LRLGSEIGIRRGPKFRQNVPFAGFVVYSDKVSSTDPT